MITWKSFLKNDSINWLLENNNPSVRYLTLMDILNKSNKNSEVIESKKKIMESGLIQKILSKQNPKGYWFEPENFYIKRKYKGTVWNLIILAEIGADGNDKRIKKIHIISAVFVDISPLTSGFPCKSFDSLSTSISA